MSPTAEKTIDESALTKGQLRKLNALRKSVGPEIGERAFAEWLASQAKAEKADKNLETIVDALWPLVQQGRLSIRRGGYLVRHGRGRLLVEPLKPTSEAATVSVENSIEDIGQPEVGTFGAVVRSGEQANATIRKDDGEIMMACKDENALQPLDAETRSKVREALTRSRGILTPREERILRMRFGIGMNAEHTVDEVAQQFAITPEEVRKIEASAFQKLKDPPRAHARKSVRTEEIPGQDHADFMMEALADETVARTGTKASPTDAEK